nr:MULTISPECIES: DUF6328 family protein [Myxococcaceae]
MKDKLKKALQENRILVLGTQVLLGFSFRAAFEEGFSELPRATQHLELLSLGLLLLTFALLITVPSFHRIVEGGEDSHRLHHLTGRLMCWVLPLFAVGIGLDLYASAEKVLGRGAGLALGVSGGAVGLLLFIAFPAVQQRRRAPEIERKKAMDPQQEQGGKGTELKDKIDHALQESRMVLPGAQALLGFQMAILLMKTFDQLPWGSRVVHLASLGCVALSVLLLLTPAAYHRIVEQGEETQHFHRVASALVLASTVPLALGLSGDAFVVVRKVLGSTTAGLWAGGGNLVLCLGLWFGFTLVARARRQRGRELQQAAA